MGSRHPGVCRFGEANGGDEQEAPFRWSHTRRLPHREKAIRGAVDAAHDAVQDAVSVTPSPTSRAYVRTGGRPARSSSNTVIGMPNSLIWSSKPRSCQPE